MVAHSGIRGTAARPVVFYNCLRSPPTQRRLRRLGTVISAAASTQAPRRASELCVSRTGWQVPGSRHGGGLGSAGGATKTSARRTSSSGLPVQHPPHKAAEEDGDHANYKEKPELSVIDHHCLPWR